MRRSTEQAPDSVRETLAAIARAIDRERIRAGLSRRAFNTQAGLAYNSTNAFLQGRRTGIDACTLLRMLEALDLDLCIINREGDNLLL